MTQYKDLERFNEECGLRIKQLRIEKGMTQEELGKLEDVHKSTIARWESGETAKIKLTTIKHMAEFFNVDPMWLMGEDVEREPVESKIFYDKETLSAVKLMYSRPEIKALVFATEKAKKEDVEKAMKIVQMFIDEEKEPKE